MTQNQLAEVTPLYPLNSPEPQPVRVLDEMPDAPVDEQAILPLDYHFTDGGEKGVFRMYPGNAQNSVTVRERVLPFPVVITKIFEGEYGGSEEKLELSFYDWTTHRWRAFTIAREALAKETTVTLVNKYGYSISTSQERRNTSSAKRFMKYLAEYEFTNYMTILRQKMVNKIGFSPDFSTFALYDPNTTIDYEGPEQKDLLKKGYVIRGESVPDYVQSVKKILEKESIAIFCYALAFASPMLKMLGAPSFSVEICRNSGFGKSLIQRLCLGVWGDPKELIRTWNLTLVGIERSLDFADGVIFCMEDAHTCKDVDMLTDVFYMAFNGKGKIRGAKYGGNSRTPEFAGILLSSTETESSERIKPDGIRRRLVEFQAKMFSTKERVSDAGREEEALHSEMHGLAGKEWTEYLISNKKLAAKWRREYRDLVSKMDREAMSQDFSNNDMDTIRDQNRLLAAVEIALRHMNKCFKFNFNVQDVMKAAVSNVYQGLKGNSKPLVALREFIEWVMINLGAHFVPNNKTGRQYGTLVAKEYIAVRPTVVTKYLNDKGYNLSVVDEWLKLEVLEKDKDGKGNPKVNVGSERSRMLKFNWGKIEEHLGEDFWKDGQLKEF